MTRKTAESRTTVEESVTRDTITEFVLHSIPDFAAYVDRDLIYRFCNNSYAEATGLTCEEIVGTHAEEILGEAAIAEMRPSLDTVLAGQPVRYEGWVAYKFDNERYVDVLYVPHIVDDEVKGFAVLVRNVTSRKRAEDQLKHQASHDMLTGLPNRSLLSEFADRVLSRARRKGTQAALFFVDLDDFKEINDDFGHDIGDGALKTVASRFSSIVRSNDYLARMGGDEFVVLVEDFVDQQALDSLAERLLRALDEPISIESQSRRIRASIGVSLFPDHGADLKSLVNCADKAMYSAKRQGGNRVSYFRPNESELVKRDP